MNGPNIFAMWFVIIAFVLFYIMAGCMFTIDMLFERDHKWSTKQGWAENSLIALVWPVVLAGAFCWWVLKGLWKTPKRLYNWWSIKPDK